VKPGKPLAPGAFDCPKIAPGATGMAWARHARAFAPGPRTMRSRCGCGLRSARWRSYSSRSPCSGRVADGQAVEGPDRTVRSRRELQRRWPTSTGGLPPSGSSEVGACFGIPVRRLTSPRTSAIRRPASSSALSSDRPCNHEAASQEGGRRSDVASATSSGSSRKTPNGARYEHVQEAAPMGPPAPFPVTQACEPTCSPRSSLLGPPSPRSEQSSSSS